MMCQRIGFVPICTIGLGIRSVSSASRVPNPPANMTTFMPSTRRAHCLTSRINIDHFFNDDGGTLPHLPVNPTDILADDAQENCIETNAKQNQDGNCCESRRPFAPIVEPGSDVVSRQDGTAKGDENTDISSQTKRNNGI